MLACVVAAAVLQMGCVSWIDISPGDLPHLSEESSAQLRDAVARGVAGGTSPTTAVTGTTLTDTDGEEVLIRAPYDARIRVSEGELLVRGPVAAVIDGSDLTVQGPDTELTHIDLSEIESVEVSQFSHLKTYLVVVGVALAVVAATIAIISVD